ncbi:heliorhodopsin HeR [Trichococcus paludicola]|uniref:heliorhodopsin HeR n=1 Tax=Trichococcus paludicola TaxID=2052942 RepID=UPI001F309D0C|nr:heliorhodopsin HeR [Trichococcus paludicola]
MVKGILIDESLDTVNGMVNCHYFTLITERRNIIMKEITTEKLRRFNLIMGGLHLVQGIAMLFLATNVIQKIGEFSPEISQFYLAFNPETRSLETASRVLFELPFGVLVASFLFISAIAHALISIPKNLNAIYNADLAKGINKFRWFEYALSSSIMIVLIATLFGIYDIASLILIFIVNATMNLFGLVMEQLNVGHSKDNIQWGPFIWGSIAGIAPWIAILLYMFGTGNFSEVPWFVWAIVGTYFVAFNTFPINMILQYKKVGKWADYLYGERVYIVLSLVAKSILAWLVLFGAMQP